MYMTKKTIRQWRQRTGIPVAALMLCAALVTGCSHDDDAGLDNGDPVAVKFTSQMAGQTAGAQASAGTKSAPGTRSGGTQITGRGTTSSGLDYIEYVAADGFLTREVFPQGIPAQYASAPSTRTATGSTGETEWVTGDAVGIFMLTAGGNLPGGLSSGADDIEYKATPGSPASGASFAPADASQTIYYPQTGAVDFLAYYPYGSKGTGTGQVTDTYIYKVSVAPQSTTAEQAAIDILYAKASNVSKSNAAVNLAFDHALSKLVINVKAGDGMGGADFSGITASLQGFPTTADLALADGTTFTNVGGTATDITPLKWTTASDPQYEATFEAILIPQSGTNAGRSVVFTVGGVPYTWTIPDAENFAPGHHYTYPVTVQQSGVTMGTPTIAPWTGIEGDPTPGTTEPLPVETVKIKAGTFQMGSPESDTQAHSSEKPRHWVRLTKDFYMSKYEVTNAQFAAFLNANYIGSDGKWASGLYSDERLIQVSSGTSDWGLHYTDKWESASGYENHPVIYVTWYGAAEYAHWADGRLPTEAEWEYACRAGTESIYNYGPTANEDYMWYSANSGSHTHRVGETKPNPWGLYDMHGNVYEWCLDQWNGSFNYPAITNESDAVVDPLITSGYFRVLRGGSWNSGAQICRSAYRFSYYPDYAHDFFGFRVVFVP